MTPKKINSNQQNIFFNQLSEQLNPRHQLLKLSKMIPWDKFEEEFGKQFTEGSGQPPKPIRLMVGLLMLQHMHGLSDEQVVSQWVENPYWQLFCGYEELQWEFPINPSSLTRWRKRIGKEGLEKILSSTIETALKSEAVKTKDLKSVIVDTTVQEGNVRYPTDTSLLNESREKLVKLAHKHGVKLRQSYARVGLNFERKAKGYAHAKQFKRLKKAKKSLKTILGRVCRDIKRKIAELPEKQGYFKEQLQYAERLLTQKLKDKNKLYSLHAPETYCIGKGKARTPYEFGQKVSLVVTHNQGLALSAQVLEKLSYDGHTLPDALKNASSISGEAIEKAFVDRGYKGHGVTNTAVYISGSRRGLSKSSRKQLKRRSAIEPHIGHMKSEGKLRRNYLKGIAGSCMNALLCAVGHNLRLILRHIRISYIKILQWIYSQLQKIFLHKDLYTVF